MANMIRKIDHLLVRSEFDSRCSDVETNFRNMENQRSRYWERMVALVDENFPKGESKERGKALVVLAFIEMMLLKDNL